MVIGPKIGDALRREMEAARAVYDQLVERREAAMEGRGRAPTEAEFQAAAALIRRLAAEATRSGSDGVLP